MENAVFLAVLFAAACHAGWNALIKVGLDPLSPTTLISVGAGLVAFLFLPFVGMPAWAAWPWLIASIAIHLIYFASLIESYRTGDLGQVYPIARGSAPLMTAAATAVFIGEGLSSTGWVGIFFSGCGSVFAGGRRRPRVQTNRSARRRLCVFHRADNLCVLCRGWHRCAAFRQSQCLFALVVCWYRGRDGALRTIPRRSQGPPRNASLLAARFCRRRLATPFLWNCDLGHDGRAHRDCCGAT